MQIAQQIRRLGARMRIGLSALRGQKKLPREAVPPARPKKVWPKKIWPKKTWLRAALLAPSLIFLYYAAGALWTHKIDDDPNFTVDPDSMLDGESLAVALAIGLLDREVDQHGWVANAPFYLPAALLHNMASFQSAIVEEISHFSESLGEILRARGAPSVDLEVTAARLAERPDIWSWDWSEPWGYLGHSEEEYREARMSLQGYNVALFDHESQFPKDKAALAKVLARFAADLQHAAAALDQEADYRPVLLSRRLGDAFYRARGMAYCQAILLRGLRRDDERLVRDHDLLADWLNAERALLRVASFSPAFIINGAPDDMLLPSHPLTQSYYVLAGRRELERLIEKLK